ncbi:hypothetical protein [Streptomyces sp900116325]|uniref:hypothetical protein n=1 Tax=Streptomyces sp. 900116325 TaxID=3154295 RepID=UPI0033A3FC7E
MINLIPSLTGAGGPGPPWRLAATNHEATSSGSGAASPGSAIRACSGFNRYRRRALAGIVGTADDQDCYRKDTR